MVKDVITNVNGKILKGKRCEGKVCKEKISTSLFLATFLLKVVYFL